MMHRREANLSRTPGPHARVRAALAACVVAACVVAGGCATHRPSRKEQARAQWNAARARVLLGLANDQYQHGNLDDSRKSCDEALAMSKQVEGLFVLRAKLDLEDGLLERAESSLAAAAGLAPADAEVDYLGGIIAERWGKPDAALSHYADAWRKNGSEVAYLLALGETLVTGGRQDEAAALLEGRLQYFESSVPLRDLLGQTYEQQGRFAEAAEMYRRGAILSADDAALLQRQAIALVKAGRFNDAATILARLLERSDVGDRLSLRLALGECQFRLGDVASARAAFQQAAREDDHCLAAWLGVARACLTLGDLGRADDALRRAAALRPTGPDAADAALLDGYLNLKRGRNEAAAVHFAAAARLAPADATALAMYGYCRSLAGEPQDAARYFRRALELNAAEPLAGEMMRSLAAADASPLLP